MGILKSIVTARKVNFGPRQSLRPYNDKDETELNAEIEREKIDEEKEKLWIHPLIWTLASKIKDKEKRKRTKKRLKK